MAPFDEVFRRSLSILLTIYFVAGVAVIAGLALAIRAVVRAYFRYKGQRVVTCPETEQYAAVEVDARHAAATCLHGRPDLRLKSCSRWPEREGCEQDCIRQLELSPIECRLRTMLTNWYAGKRCYYCRCMFGEIHWWGDKPALLTPEGKIVEWEALRPEAVPIILNWHKPVCWNCKVVEAFYLDHGELVTARPVEKARARRD